MERLLLSGDYHVWDQPLGTARQSETLTGPEVSARFPWLATMLWWAALGSGFPQRLVLALLVTTRRQLVILQHLPSAPETIRQLHFPALPPRLPTAPQRYRVSVWRPALGETVDIYSEPAIISQVLPPTMLEDGERLSEFQLQTGSWTLHITLLESQVIPLLVSE